MTVTLINKLSGLQSILVSLLGSIRTFSDWLLALLSRGRSNVGIIIAEIHKMWGGSRSRNHHSIKGIWKR